jgi:3-hydroxyisobutyrate dehydrogenase-like beta-hydroxyacid dehydrogenase
MSERIAVIGMGQMGAGMAARLTEGGFEVLGYDVSPARRQELAERQVAVADTLAAALAGRRPGWASRGWSPWPSRAA